MQLRFGGHSNRSRKKDKTFLLVKSELYEDLWQNMHVGVSVFSQHLLSLSANVGRHF